MPQFTYIASNPDAVYADTATGSKGKRIKLWQGAAGDGSSPKVQEDNAGGSTGGGVPVATGKTAAQRAAERRAAAKKRREERAAARAAAEAAKRNPLTAPFKTPAELRKDAAELAAMGVGSEDALRATAAQQQAGLGGLTSALTGTLTGLADRTQAGLAGFGNLYSQLAGQAQSAGQSQAAAAGAPTSIAPGASPTMASNLANLAAPTMGYAPAAAVTGAQMQGAVTANLTKALMDRSSKLSADTAKYLYQLKSDELQRAISQGTLAQNEARLGLSAENQTWDQKMDLAGLNLRQQSLNLQAQTAAAKIQKDLASIAGKGAKKIESAKSRILFDVTKWTQPKKVNSGTYEFKFSSPAGDLSAVGTSADDAWQNAIANKQTQPGTRYATFTQGDEIKKDVPPTNEDVIKMLQPILVGAGMKPKNARAWILKNVLYV